MTFDTQTPITPINQVKKEPAFINLGNFLFIPAGLLLIFSYGLHPEKPFTLEVVSSPFWVMIHGAFLLSLLCGIFSVFSALARYLGNPTSSALGVFGACLGVVGLFLTGGLDYAETFIFPTLVIDFPAVLEKYGAGNTMPSAAFALPAVGLLTILGYIILSFELYRTRCIPAWVGRLTIVGALIFGVGLSGFGLIFFAKAGAVIFGLGLISLGWGLLSRRPAAT
ncbi:hypothetical protein [Acaryochloris sp. IP29b_bin.148]|uniref:hypothetical protein n=1 Tax=Acaryochloris sp. IP29b_bin.148 TaxID=2969218 RepID=UPI002637703C|nr:hypothetical protein [Acaryochloris sp. IP29b_bin.148]